MNSERYVIGVDFDTLSARALAAVAAGAYRDVPAAGEAMGRRGARSYVPDPGTAHAYDRLYAEYSRVHDYFGRGDNDVMHRLRELRGEVLS